MLALTKKTGYGLIAMTHLARLQAGQVASAREVADRYNIPTSLLMNVLKELAAAGYIESLRGPHGGYRLAVDPGQVTLADLITALEGPIRLAECIADEQGVSDDQPCRLLDSCPIADPVHRVHRRLSDFLRTVTLAEIVAPAGAAAKE